MKIQQYLISILLATTFMALTAFSSLAQPLKVSFANVVVDYDFDQYATFECELLPAGFHDDIKTAFIQIEPGDAKAILEPVEIQPSGKIQHTHMLAETPWRPFIQVQFRFYLEMKDDTRYYSDLFSFTYEDDRFKWNNLNSAPFELYWNGDDNQLGQLLLRTASAGLQSARTYVNANPEGSIRIYAYSKPEDLQSALKLGEQQWLAGHTTPQNNLILLSTPSGPGLQLELERQLPHEIAHILTYSLTGNHYTKLPVWLTEGIATVSEIYPSTEYQRVLNSAAATGGLLPIASLCETFPSESSAAFLAYAQSGSFTNFLYKKYGTSGIESLMAEYSEGVSCENALLSVYGQTLAELEYNWQQEVFGIDSSRMMLQNLSPFLTLLLAILVVPVSPFLFRRRTKIK